MHTAQHQLSNCSVHNLIVRSKSQLGKDVNMKILNTAIVTSVLALGLAGNSMAAPTQAELLIMQQKAAQAKQKGGHGQQQVARQRAAQAQQQQAAKQRALQVQQQAAKQRAIQAQQQAAKQRAAKIQQQQAAQRRAAIAQQQAAKQRAIQAQQQAAKQRALQIQQQAAKQRAIQARQQAAKQHSKRVVVKPAPHKQASHSNYRVQTGDTLYRIAQRNNIPVQTLVQLNGLFGSKATNLSIGAVIRLR